MIESLAQLTNASIEELVAGGLLSAAGIFIFLKRIALRAAVDDTKISSVKAAREVIDLLRAEVERLSNINSTLAGEINSLKFENMKLNIKVSELSNTLEEMKVKLDIVAIRGRNGERIGDEERRGANVPH